MAILVLAMGLAALFTAQPEAMPGSCTTFAVQTEDAILFGNNEDYHDPNTVLWVVPSSDESYGGIYFGYQMGSPQGGINEKGLAFDGLALPHTPMNWDPDKPGAGRSFTRFWAGIMASSATVEEAILNSSQYNWGNTIAHQILIADASGDMAVVGPGLDGELAVTRRSAGNDYLVATNFNLADPAHFEGEIPCWRYETAQRLLAQGQADQELSVEAVQNILDAVHVEGESNNTLYSNVFDVRNGVVYMYYWHQFDEVVVLDVAEEIAAQPGLRKIKDLFSLETVGRAEREYLRYRGELPLIEDYYVFTWFGLAGLALLYVGGEQVRKQAPPTKINLFWLVVIFCLGPVGFAAYWFAYRKPFKESSTLLSDGWRALAAAAVSASGYAFSFLVMLVVIKIFMLEGSSGLFSLLVPMLVGMLLFRAPLRAALTHSNYVQAARHSILIEVITTLFALAAVIFADEMMRWNLGDLYARTNSLSQPLFWGMLALYAAAILIVIYPFHLWLVRNGFYLWTEGFQGRGEIMMKVGTAAAVPLRRAWPFLLAGFGLLVLAGVISA